MIETREWRMEDLPCFRKMKLKVIRQTSHQFRGQGLMRRKILSLVIATDAGREGELVARWIMEMANWKNPSDGCGFPPRLIMPSEGFGLQAGKATTTFNAAVCRAEADWLIGNGYPGTDLGSMPSSMPVSTDPHLAMIVQRENDISGLYQSTGR